MCPRRREFFGEAIVTGKPCDRRSVAASSTRERQREQMGRRDGRYLAPLYHGHGFVQQLGEVTDQPALGLAPLAEQDDVVPRQDAAPSRDDRVLEPHDAFEQPSARRQAASRLPKLLF